MNASPITSGATVRVTRYNPQGGTHFIKVGRVGEVAPTYFQFTEATRGQGFGSRAYVSTDEALPAQMKGWTQTTEILEA